VDAEIPDDYADPVADGVAVVCDRLADIRACLEEDGDVAVLDRFPGGCAGRRSYRRHAGRPARGLASRRG